MPLLKLANLFLLIAFGTPCALMPISVQAHVPSPTYYDERLYLIGDTDILTCLDARSGDTLWQQRLRGKFSMSPLLLDDRLLLVNEDGRSYLIQAGSRFELLAENRRDETIVATPAILDGRIYFRTQSNLICVGAKP